MSPRLLALIPIAVGINLAMGKIVEVMRLPMFLDTIGTVLVAAMTGPVGALVTGFMSQVALTVIGGSFVWPWFLPVQLAVAVYASLAAKAGAFGSLPKTIVAGLGCGVLAATMSWPISYLVFGGVTGGGVTVITTLLTGIGVPLQWSVLFASLSSDLVDKLVVFLIVRTLLLSLPLRLSAQFPLTLRALGRA